MRPDWEKGAWQGFAGFFSLELSLLCRVCLRLLLRSEVAFGHQSTHFQVARAIVFLHADFNTDFSIGYLYLPLHRNK